MYNSKFYIFLFISCVMMSTAGCNEVKFGGMTAHESFSDPKVGDLIETAINGKFDEVDALIQSGADVNSVGAEGVSPIIWVLAARRRDGVIHLFKVGADASHKMNNGHSAMSLAAGGNDPHLLELLLINGGDPDATGPNKDPLLHIAALHQDEKRIKLLLEYNADINSSTFGGYTVANVAISQGRFDIAAYLLDQGLSENLDRVARSVKTRVVPKDSEQYQWKLKVIEMLKARGVEYPPAKRK